MRDTNLAGQCVNCGGSTYGQSECDACANGDSEYTCPECGDHCHNLVNETEPIKDCFDHTEDGDVRNYARREIQGLRAEIQRLMGKPERRQNVMEGTLCTTCGAKMESRRGDIAGVDAIVSICANPACGTSTCALLGDTMGLFKEQKTKGRYPE